MSLYSANGKINTTTVIGDTYTGLHDANGGINVVLDDTAYFGIEHPCGAVRVNSATGNSYYDDTGAAYSNQLLGVGIE